MTDRHQDARLPDGGRFVALRSLRGVAALLVVSFHVFDGGVAPDRFFASHGRVFVDFFFEWSRRRSARISFGAQEWGALTI